MGHEACGDCLLCFVSTHSITVLLAPLLLEAPQKQQASASVGQLSTMTHSPRLLERARALHALMVEAQNSLHPFCNTFKIGLKEVLKQALIWLLGFTWEK